MLEKLGKQCAHGGHPAAPIRGGPLELFSHVGISDPRWSQPQGTNRLFSEQYCQRLPVWASWASGPAALAKGTTIPTTLDE